jgi:hypothetical protein
MRILEFWQWHADVWAAIGQIGAAIATVLALWYAVLTQRQLVRSRGWATASSVSLRTRQEEPVIHVTVHNGGGAKVTGLVIITAGGKKPIGALKPGENETLSYAIADLGRVRLTFRDEFGQPWVFGHGEPLRPISYRRMRKETAGAAHAMMPILRTPPSGPQI